MSRRPFVANFSSNRRSSAGHSGSSFGRGRSGGGFRRFPIKSVNPALLVNQSVMPQVEVAPYVPKNAFADFQIHDKLKANVITRGYTTPTPIQDQAIPALLAGRDVVGIANTGTGKTAAFLLPLIHKILTGTNERALIIAPTRELAVQIQDEAQLFTANLGIHSLICIGGVDMFRQIQGLRRYPHIVIGTPGRLKDLSNRGVLNFNSFRSIVLDEVDRMLDMGFINDVRFIVGKLPSPRQSLFFSATLTPEVSNVMKTFLNNPVTISVKTQETASGIKQDVIKVNGRPKPQVLEELLRGEAFNKVLIFGRTKFGIDKLAVHLIQKGFRVAAIHGNKNQNQRQRALDSFKNNSVSILLATDIAARGLDIPDVTHVINYDLPASYEDYVHRIGRTGRAGKCGQALSLID